MPETTEQGPGGTTVVTRTDANGRPLERTTTLPGPPRWEKVETWVYDNGNLKKKTTSTHNEGGDPTTARGDSVLVENFAQIGGQTQPTRKKLDNRDPDGTPTTSHEEEYEYDEQGRLKRKKHVETYHPAGEVDTREEEYIWIGGKRLLKRRRTTGPKPGGGTVEYVEEWEYDGEGNVTGHRILGSTSWESTTPLAQGSRPGQQRRDAAQS